jgi:hypothetical protein
MKYRGNKRVEYIAVGVRNQTPKSTHFRRAREAKKGKGLTRRTPGSLVVLVRG